VIHRVGKALLRILPQTRRHISCTDCNNHLNHAGSVVSLNLLDSAVSIELTYSDFNFFDMCDRDIITREYRNCTKQPKHTLFVNIIRSCQDVGTATYKGIKDNSSFGKSTVYGGICPKC
jgi:hypothetical protein